MGRTDELLHLAGIADAVTSGDRRVLLINGEAGVGKSRMVSEFARVVRDRGCRILVGRCVEFGEQIWPLAALRELLACLVDEFDDESLDLVLGSSGSVLRHLVPELGSAPQSPMTLEGDRLCELVIGAFHRLGHWGPVVVVFEDLHWADASTRTLFSLLARSSRPHAMLLVGTYRFDELPRRHPLRPVLAEVVRFARPEQWDLARFDRRGTGELVAAIAGDSVDSTSVDEIHRLSEGNAFFIEELVAAHSAGVQGFPKSLRDLIVARTVAVSDAAIGLLSIVAVAGRVSSAVLAAASGADTASVAIGIDELTTAGLLVVDGDELCFPHELARNVFLDDLTPEARTAVHANLACSIAALRPGRRGEIARHWSGAQCHGPALVAWLAAGRAAMGDGAPSEAEGHFCRALELWSMVGDPESVAGTDLAAVLVDAAAAAYHARHLDPAIELACLAITQLSGRDPWREGDVWLRLRAMYRFTSRWEECASALERALDVIPTLPPSMARVEALADAALGHMYANRGPAALECAEMALGVASSLGDVDAIVLARNAVGAALATLDPSGKSALDHARATVAMCGPAVSPERTLIAYSGLAYSLLVVGRFAEAIDVASAGVELVRSSGLGGPLGTAIAQYWVGCLVTLGRWSEAEVVSADLADLLAHPADRDPFLFMEITLVRQGRLDEVRHTMERVRTLLGEPEFWTESLCELGAIVIEFDDADGGRVDPAATVDELLDRCRDRVSYGHWQLIAAAVASLADRLERAGGRVPNESTAALTLANRWIDHVDTRDETVAAEECVDRGRALAELSRLAGRPDPEAWSQVAAGCEDLGMRYGEAHARWRWAEALLAGVAGRTSTARCAAAGVLRRARALAIDLPAPPLLREIDSLVACARLNLRQDVAAPIVVRSPTDALGLTRRERDVLELVACGLSNGAIGERLFISRKTASVHVSNILRKLSLDNRIEAAAVLHRQADRVVVMSPEGARR